MGDRGDHFLESAKTENLDAFMRETALHSIKDKNIFFATSNSTRKKNYFKSSKIP